MRFTPLALALAIGAAVIDPASAISCASNGVKTPRDMCFCLKGYSGTTCNIPPDSGEPFPSSEFDCRTNVDWDQPNSCTRKIQNVNAVVSDVLTQRITYSNKDTDEWGRLTELPKGFEVNGPVAPITEFETLYIERVGYNGLQTVRKFDVRTGETTDFSSSTTGTSFLNCLHRSIHAGDDAVYVCSGSSILKMDFDGNLLATLASGSYAYDIAQVYGLEGQQKKLIVLVSGGSIHQACDTTYASSLPCTATTLVNSGTYSGVLQSIDVIPDEAGTWSANSPFTIFGTLSSGGSGVAWLSPVNSYIGWLGDYAGTDNKRYLDPKGVVYDGLRGMVYVSDYSYGAPTAWTKHGQYLGELGPGPGYVSGGYGIAIIPGPYPKDSTFSPPFGGSVTAGRPALVTIKAKDNVGEIWQGDSAELYSLTASGTLANGADVIYEGKVSLASAEKGQYQGSMTFTETGLYEILVTQLPGDQMLTDSFGNPGSQTIRVNAAPTVPKKSEQISSDCKYLMAGSSCVVEVVPKDEFGNVQDDTSRAELFTVQVVSTDGTVAFTTEVADTDYDIAPLYKYGINTVDVNNYKSGKYMLQVLFEDEFISGSPYQLEIHPAPFNVTKTVCEAEIADGLVATYDPEAGYHSFLIHMYDSYDNFVPATQAHIADLVLEWYRPNAKFADATSNEIDIGNVTTTTVNGYISVLFVDTARDAQDLRVSVGFEASSSAVKYLDNGGSQYFHIDYTRQEVASSALSTDVILGIAIGGVLLVAFFAFLMYNEKVKYNKLQEKSQNQKFTQEEMRQLEVIMSKASFGDELTETTYLSDDVEISKRLGMGAFGEVFLANHKDKVVAIKTLKQISESNVVRFRGEMVLIKGLKHPNIVLYEGCVWDKEMIGLMLEFVDGGNLSDVLQDEKMHLTWKEPKLQMATDIADAMVYLHATRYWEEEKQEWQKCIIHRDLKPDNMLVCSGSMKIKLTDFGEARARKPDKTMTQVGTPIFIAPEVMKGERYDERCDVFSFAVCLLDMMQISPNIVELFAEAYIEFKHSDAGLSLVAITHSVVTEGLRPKIPDSVPAHLRELVQECWELDPEARPYFPEILDRLGYECKAEIFGIPLEEAEAQRRALQRQGRIESARLNSSRSVSAENEGDGGGKMIDFSKVQESSGSGGGSANSTARIDKLLSDKTTQEKKCKVLEEENKKLQLRIDDLESISGAPGAVVETRKPDSIAI